MTALPRALDSLPEITRTIGARRPAFFLDFDGTIAPMTPHPELAKMPEVVREVLAALATDHVVCIVSGRDLTDLRRRVDLPNVYCAGDHGYRIAGPAGSGVELEVGGPEERRALERASYELESRLHQIKGVFIEAKNASLSVHYRLVAEDLWPLVHQIVEEVAEAVPGLKLSAGKLVYEFRPCLPWDKGRAVLWLLGQLRLHADQACPICIGDDLTDEDMFAAVRRWGLGIVVGESSLASTARYRLSDPMEVLEFLRMFVQEKNDDSPLSV